MKIDCSITENFFKEWRRMCDTYRNCGGCPLVAYRGNTIEGSCGFYENPKCVIEKVQAWSDNNQFEIDWNKVPIDTPVLVRDAFDEEWEERYFAAYLPNASTKFFTFDDDSTIKYAQDIIHWVECKLADNVDPTPYYK